MPTDLHGGQPRRERARVVLDQDPEEPLDRAEQRPVDHVRPLPGAVRRGVLDAEPARLLEVHLQRGQLPAAADGVLHVHVDLGGVERALALGDHVRQPGVVQRVPQRGLGLVPLLRLPDVSSPARVDSSGRTRRARKSRSRSTTNSSSEASSPASCSGVQKMCESSWVRPRTRVSPCTTPGLLVPVHGAELEQPQRQLAVGPPARLIDQDVHRAVHRLHVVRRAVQLHRREHALGVPAQVTGGLEQVRLGHVRGVDVLVAGLLVAPPRVVLHHPPDGRRPGGGTPAARCRSRSGTRTGPARRRACGDPASPPRPSWSGRRPAPRGTPTRCRRSAAAAGSSRCPASRRHRSASA